jgi:hypothetical protein
MCGRDTPSWMVTCALEFGVEVVREETLTQHQESALITRETSWSALARLTSLVDPQFCPDVVNPFRSPCGPVRIAGILIADLFVPPLTALPAAGELLTTEDLVVDAEGVCREHRLVSRQAWGFYGCRGLRRRWSLRSFHSVAGPGERDRHRKSKGVIHARHIEDSRTSGNR